MHVCSCHVSNGTPDCAPFACLCLHRKELQAEQREYKKKKAQKKVQRMKELEQEREDQKSKWQQFNNKAYSKNKKGQVSKGGLESVQFNRSVILIPVALVYHDTLCPPSLVPPFPSGKTEYIRLSGEREWKSWCWYVWDCRQTYDSI